MKIEKGGKNNLVKNEIVQSIPITIIIDNEENLVMLYKWVRDFPFVAMSSTGNYFKDLMYIKVHQRGSCSPKHYFLGAIYESLGIPVKYLTYPFYWKDLDIDWPDSIKRLVEKMPLQYHLAIEITVDEQSFFLDATWDSPLEKVGFPVNRIGDKLTNTKNAIVPYNDPIIHQTAFERIEFKKRLLRERATKGIEDNFYSVLNTWLEDIRRHT